MRVIVWGINYAPELTGIAPFNTGLCDQLRAHGHHVEMVTTFPYYPAWKKVPGDRGRAYRMDDIDGVWIHRCWHYVPSQVTALKRMCHELSFGFTSFIRILFLARADVYVVVSPPLVLGPLAFIIGLLKNRRYVFHVQDLQPDAAVGLGMVKFGILTRLLYMVEAFSYRHAAFVSGISNGMLDAYARKGVPSQKQVLFPNWVRWYGRNTGLLETIEERGRRAAAFRSKYGIAGNVFLVSYSGNLGKKQGLETLVEAAALVERREMVVGTGRIPSPTLSVTKKTREILILVVGDGATKIELNRRVKGCGLSNIRLLPLMVEADYHGLLAASDISLVLQASGTGRYFFPSKLLSILSIGSPVLSAADEDSEVAEAVRKGGFGINVRPGNPKALADALVELAENPPRLAELGAKTRWVEQFSGTTVIAEFERKLVGVAYAGEAPYARRS